MRRCLGFPRLQRTAISAWAPILPRATAAPSLRFARPTLTTMHCGRRSSRCAHTQPGDRTTGHRQRWRTCGESGTTQSWRLRTLTTAIRPIRSSSGPANPFASAVAGVHPEPCCTSTGICPQSRFRLFGGHVNNGLLLNHRSNSNGAKAATRTTRCNSAIRPN